MVKKVKPIIVVVGSVNMDLVVTCDRLPEPGETISGGTFSTIPGGKGANQAVAAARLGAQVYLVGRIGDDAFGKTLREGLEKNGVNTQYLKTTSKTASGTATIMVTSNGENAIIVAPGANGTLTPMDVERAAPVLRRADAVLMQLEIPYACVKRAISICKSAGVTSVLDPAPAPAHALPSAFYKVDVLTPNQAEAASILCMKDVTPQIAIRKLLSRGAKDIVLKLGKSGAIHADATHVMQHVSGFKVKAVDTTAAGDSFTAGLAIARAQGKSWADALRFANACGAIACTTFGAQPSLPRRQQVTKLLTE